jgi:16S rRNA A1518/A1519 N6-dimethyltransferase RsmA/KsgA/DIM1 with predicted DNA glycosylase/AP lyase activity
MTNNSLEDRIKSSKRRYQKALQDMSALSSIALFVDVDNELFEPSSTVESAAYRLIQESNQLRSLLTVEE